MKSKILAIDIGTHSVRSAILCTSGKVLNLAGQSIKVNNLDNERIEQNGEEILNAVNHTLSAVLTEPIHTPQIDHAAIAIQRSTVIAWHPENGKTLSPAISWQDTRGRQQVNSLKHCETEIHRLSGLVLSPHYGASKIHWLRQQLADQKKLCIGPLISYLLFHLLENAPYLCDESNASRTQLWDIQQRRWSKTLCEYFSLSTEALPSVLPTHSHYGQLKNGNIPLKLVCGDQNAAFLGLTNSRRPIVINAGTGAFVLSNQPAPPGTGILTTIAQSTNESVDYLSEACINGCAAAITYFCQQYDLTQDEFFNHIPSTPDNKKQLPIFINCVGGLASPWWKGAHKSFFIDSDSDSIQERCIAVIESIAFLISKNIQFIETGNKEGNWDIIIGGGVSQSNYLCQTIANLTQKKVYRTDAVEATLIGLAKASDNEDLPPTAKTFFRPYTNIELQSRYHQAITVYETLT
ncbi:FGGY family carbohydrate kinase [Teredinibacter sp. KSP-S5-2]|uniref:FGGY family carbohydrate kinase n=1 Tax=Teredinibacter sp. KSP-S5-2 TaxID=3034506 RepID=UPI002934F40B|nr:FGGY family carbohydrate kinase [Teredinibacter sp. KSP-S5-2]WNO09778.1 FGGY family carbohydrate kinase [Teredinibacter sp. KSP-S5-2]